MFQQKAKPNLNIVYLTEFFVSLTVLSIKSVSAKSPAYFKNVIYEPTQHDSLA